MILFDEFLEKETEKADMFSFMKIFTPALYIKSVRSPNNILNHTNEVDQFKVNQAT